MTTNRVHLFGGAILTGALLVGTASLAFAQDPTAPSGLPGTDMGGSGMSGASNMMGTQAMSGASNTMGSQAISWSMNGAMGRMHASMTADELQAMGTMHASMTADQLKAMGTMHASMTVDQGADNSRGR